MENNAASGAATAAGSAAGIVDALGDLLRYGVPGLALAVLIVAFVSLNLLQKRVIEGRVAAERIAPFERLQRLYLNAAVVVFCVGSIAPPVLEHYFKPPVNAKHRVAFSVSPTRFDRDDLAPRLVVAGDGTPIAFRNGTAEDSVSDSKTYQFEVDQLVKEIQDQRFLALDLQRQLGRVVGGPDANGNR